MQYPHPLQAIRAAAWAIVALWLLWLLIWLFTALQTKPVAQRLSLGQRVTYRAPILLSMVLLALGRRTHLGAMLSGGGPAVAWLYGRFIRLYPGVVLLGAPLVLIGLGVAVWARVYLGANWSGAVTFKQDHELVRSGPYRLARHPIYTGVLLALAGSACAIGQWRAILGVALALIGLWYKSQLEERLMLEHFGAAYREYQRRVKALIPYLF
jgi:hypothetical protein